MAIAISFALFVVLMAAITYYGYRTYARPARLYQQLAPEGVADLTHPAQRQPGEVVRILKEVGEKLPISARDAGLTRRMLMAAGYRSDFAVPVYYAVRVILAAFLFLCALAARPFVVPGFVTGTMFLIGAAAAGYFLPAMWLDRQVDSRRERLRFALPDALDLLVVGVEAGLGLDQALHTVARELRDAHPDLADEFNIVHLEMRAGTSRAEALRNLARRTGERSVRQLTSIMIQSDRFGTSMAEALRTHSDFMRVRRRQEAEERANKVGVKLVFPIFFFILPSMLVVAAGSGVLQLVKYLFPIMRNFQSPTF